MPSLRRPPLLRHVLAARARVHVLREEGVVGHLAVAGGVVEEEEADAAWVEDLEDGDGMSRAVVGVLGSRGLAAPRAPRLARLCFFGGILKGAPRTRVTPLFQEGSHGVTQASKNTLALVWPLFSSQGASGPALGGTTNAKPTPPLFDPPKKWKDVLRTEIQNHRFI